MERLNRIQNLNKVCKYPGSNWKSHNMSKTRKISNWKKKAAVDANTKMTEMLELSDKDFKPAIVKILQWVIINMLETD